MKIQRPGTGPVTVKCAVDDFDIPSWDVMFQQDSLGFEMCSQVILVLCNRFGEFLLSLYIPRCVGLLLQFRPSVFEFVLGAKHSAGLQP
jgi:hypothetical protein